MQKFLDLLKRFRKDERGAFLAIFGVLGLVLIATAGATIDFTSVQNARTRAQVALDAAALALQPEIYSSAYANEAAMEVAVKNLAKALLIDRLNDPKITIVGDVIADGNEGDGTLTLKATLKAPLIFVALVGISEMSMTVVSQATKGSQDLEVAVALDVTGSMAQNDKIGAMIDAANDMVDTLVLDQQTPTYTKMAIIPWSMGVNVGSDAAAARGAIPAAKAVTGASWIIGTSKNISAITKANPARVTTSSNHGLTTGDFVYISGVNGMTQVNNRYYTITRVSNTRFTLNGVNSTNYGTYTNSGTSRECQTSTCEVVITSTAHGFANNQVVYFTGVGGMTQLNNNAFTAAAVTADTFKLSGSLGPSMSAYTSGGSAWCTTHGCNYFRFQDANGNWKIYQPTTCVTERVASPNQYTDVAPGTSPVGLKYLPSAGDCQLPEIVPLTSDKDLLHDTIDALEAEGSTSGQIGAAWAWYALAPNFASLWPTANQPAAYNSGNLIKVAVLMTDGSFNTVYCNGVISDDSSWGNDSDQINCNATNGDPFDQAKDICDGMKAGTGIVVYTVGFDISDQSEEQDVLSYCATDTSKFFLADDEEELNEAFQAIAQDIAQLRLSE